MTDNTPDKDAHFAGLYINGNMPDEPPSTLCAVVSALIVAGMLLGACWVLGNAAVTIVTHFADWFVVCANCGMGE